MIDKIKDYIKNNIRFTLNKFKTFSFWGIFSSFIIPLILAIFVDKFYLAIVILVLLETLIDEKESNEKIMKFFRIFKWIMFFIFGTIIIINIFK